MVKNIIEKSYLRVCMLVFLISIFSFSYVDSAALPTIDDIHSPEHDFTFTTRDYIFINVNLSSSEGKYKEAFFEGEDHYNLSSNGTYWTTTIPAPKQSGQKTLVINISNDTSSNTETRNGNIISSPANLSVSLNSSVEYNQNIYIDAQFTYYINSTKSEPISDSTLAVEFFKNDNPTSSIRKTSITDQIGNASWTILCDYFLPGNWTFNISYSYSDNSGSYEYEEKYIEKIVEIKKANATINMGYIRLTDNETLVFAYAKDAQGRLEDAPKRGSDKETPKIKFYKNSIDNTPLVTITISEGFAYTVLDLDQTTSNILAKVDHNCYTNDTKNISYYHEINFQPTTQDLYQGNYLNVSFPIYCSNNISNINLNLYSQTNYIKISLENVSYNSEKNWYIYSKSHYIGINYREGNYTIEFDFNDTQSNSKKFTNIEDETTGWEFKLNILKVDLVCEINRTKKEKSGDHYYYIFYLKAYYVNSNQTFEGTITLEIRDRLISASYDTQTGLWVADYVTDEEIEEIEITAFDSYDHSTTFTKTYDVDKSSFDYKILIPIFTGAFLGLIMMMQYKNSRNRPKEDYEETDEIEISEKFSEEDGEQEEKMDEEEMYSKLQDDLFK